MIDRQTIERIKDAADIVDVVSEFVSLRKVGANYRGLCPFHNDHTPSFYVSPSRRTCHCFVCGEGGDSVGFIMRHEQLTYPDALRWLAGRYHIEIEEKQLTDEQRREQSEREAMFIVNEWAAGYFHNVLENDVDGRAIGKQYFRQRGIRDDIMERFRLGFCLNDRQAMASEALKKGYKQEYLLKTGLCYSRDNGELVDRFAGRAIFPWIGVSGKVVAFGGRVLDARTKGVNQKYVNSPDSDIYHKDRELYGIFQAKKSIAREDCVYMVEGYTDVISMHQCGIENVVANSGTALSEHQIHILHRFTTNIVLLYDGDAAGIKAALRGTDMLLKEDMNVKVLLLPDGDDPDSFARKHTAEEFRTYISEHQVDFIEFKTRVLLEGVTDPVKRSEAISSIIKSVSVIGDPIVRATYIQACASRLGIQEQTLIAKMNDNIRDYRDEQRKEEERRRRNAAVQAQDYNSTGQQPSMTDGSVTATDSAAQPSYGYDDMPPPDAFLPPEAFSTPQSQPVGGQHAEVNARLGGTRSEASAGKMETVSDMLIRAVVKHGHEILFDNVETEDGGTTSLTLAEYVSYDLAADSLEFSVPLYNRILDEAVTHSHDEDFNSERYFTMHPDYEVSSKAIQLTADRVLLSKSMQVKYTEDTLRDQTTHLLLDFRQELVNAKLAQLRTDIAMASGDTERQMQLMKELHETQKIRNAIAKKIGGSVLLQ
ncbi:MAG: DNA primase [Prevotellaceae bacterium]|nr:DNA primase [Prevotellaceae bacterium]